MGKFKLKVTSEEKKHIIDALELLEFSYMNLIAKEKNEYIKPNLIKSKKEVQEIIKKLYREGI